MTEELKPCPFCGGAVEIKQTGKKQLTLSCLTFACIVMMRQKVLTNSLDWLKEIMIKKWNKRSCGRCASIDFDPPSKPGFGGDW